MTFAGITGYSSESENNYMIEILSIKLTTTLNSWIHNVVAYNSSIGFYVNNGDYRNTTSEPRTLEMVNMTYRDSVIDYSVSLILLEEIYTQEDVYISFENIEFSNLTFLSGGNMMSLKQQMRHPVNITNLYMEDIVGGSFLVEATNKQSLDNPTIIHLHNFTTSNVNLEFSSLILTLQGGELYVYDSQLSNIFWFEEGAVLFAGFRDTTVAFHNTLFQNNTSINGANFNIEDSSVVKWYGCTFSDNFAVQGGVLVAREDGYFELYNSTITNNYALSYSAFEIFNSAEVSIVDNCTINRNEVITQAEILSEINVRWSKLWFLTQEFKTFINERLDVLSIIASKYAFGSIYGAFIIRNYTRISEQAYTIDSFSSTVTVEDTSFDTIELVESTVKFSNTNFTFSGTNITGITAANNSEFAFITGSLDSKLDFNNIKFYENSVPLIEFRDSSDLENGIFNTISDIEVFDWWSPRYTIVLDDVGGIAISDIRLYNISTNADTIFFTRESEISSLDNLQANNISKNILGVKKTNIISANNVTITNWLQGITLTDESNIALNQSTFMNLGTLTELVGGALQIVDSNLTVSRSTFSNNRGYSGAAIKLDCVAGTVCSYMIDMNNFTSNTAIESGGAIYYNMFRPVMLSNIFDSNTAQYGKDIASYPIRIGFSNSLSTSIYLTNVGSGIQYNESLVLALYDYDNQVYNLDSFSQISIKSIGSDTGVSGINNVKVENGVSDFQDIAFSASPGSINIPFSVSSKAIDTSKLNTVYSNINNVSVN